ncbi:MAG: glycosyltransferase family 39 protein, partial [Candidatus Coatesbacteria bacterium]|nr:glycosyltransferase family 39 protein [Candidatus Coatesbacteria bacterium]
MTQRRALWLLALIIAVQVGASVFWIAYDERPPFGQDCVRHSLAALELVPDAPRFAVDLTKSTEPYLSSYPPAHAYALSSAYRVFGISKNTACSLSAVLFAVTLIFVFATARSLFPESYFPALMATFAVGCFPAVLAASRYPNLSMMLTLFVTICIFALVRSKGLRSAPWAMVLGIAMGIGLLVKWTFVLFVAVSFLWTLLGNVSRSDVAKRIRNAIIAIGVASSVALPWYLSHLKDIMELWRYNKDIYGEFYGEGYLSIHSLTFYAVRLMDGVTPSLAVLVVLAAIVLVARRQLRITAMPLLWIGGAYVGLSFMRPLWPRYIVPAYPAIALVLSMGLSSIPLSRVRALLMVSAAVAGVVVFAQSVVPYDFIASSLKRSFFESRIAPIFPEDSDWGISEIMRAVEDDWSPKSGPPTIAVLPKPPELMAIWCTFESIMKGKRMLFNSLAADEFFWRLVESDYIVTRTGPFLSMSWETDFDPHPQIGGLNDSQTRGVRDYLQSPPDLFSRNFRMVARFEDRGQIITVVRRVAKFTVNEQIELLQTLSPIFRRPEQEDIALRILYRRKGWYRHSMEVWERLEDAGHNRSWLETERGPDLIDVLEAEDMV